MNKIHIVAMTAFLIALSSCSVNPNTWVNAARGHATFPTLALAVQGCIADRPDVQSAITPAWNRTFDKWEATKGLEPDVNAIKTIAGFPIKLAEAERDALYIESVIIDAGLDCGPIVRSEWANVKTTFTEIKTAVASNQRVVVAAEWASVLSSIVQIEVAGDVTRMPDGPKGDSL